MTEPPLAHRTATWHLWLTAVFLPLGVAALVTTALAKGLADALGAIAGAVVWAAVVGAVNRRVVDAPAPGTVLADVAQTRRVTLRTYAAFVALVPVLAAITVATGEAVWVWTATFVMLGQGLLSLWGLTADRRWERDHPGVVLVTSLGFGHRARRTRWRLEWGDRAPDALTPPAPVS